MLKKSLIDSWSFFKIHVLAISIIILPIVAPIEIFSALYQYFVASEEFLFSEQLIPIAIQMAAYPIYAVGVVFYIASVISGEPIDAKTSWRLGAKFWLSYIVMSVFIGAAIMFGLILLIIPGVIFAARYAFADFDLLLNQSKPLDAMKNSWDITKDYIWVILGGYVMITIVFYVPYYLIALLFDESSVAFWLLDTASNIIYSVLAALYTIFAFRIYEFAKSQHNQLLNPDAP
jgi:hypothetical protein